ncbi:MAG TPA: PglZ domain-containing protein [Desulfosporosinus sp.]|nr:PglZ domain-containing protein [Desulfosporosinus sp.]
MNSIQEFIKQQVILLRLNKNGVLTVYDPELRYRELCMDLNSQEVRVIDTSESSILSRELAIKTLSELGSAQLKGMIVYVPARRPVNDEEKQQGPFALYGACGSVFPDGDGDDYLSICLRARPDCGTQIRQVFSENPSPTFAVIDAVGGGQGWPALQSLLKVESARDILLALLVPSKEQQNALKEQEGWVAEAKELFRTSLDLKLLTKGKTWSTIADELWRFILFSEFVFDLPETLPESLNNVPRALSEARRLVEYLCDNLRSDRRTQNEYISRATTIEQDLALDSHCAGAKDLGRRDTFPFEDLWFLERAIESLKKDDHDAVRKILQGRESSVWSSIGESQVQWGLVMAVLELVEACADYERQLPDYTKSMTELIDFYVASLREMDRIHREFEQAAGDYLETRTNLYQLVDLGRIHYRRLSEKAHDIFIRHFEQSGWPVAGKLSNSEVFDRFIAPRLTEKGHRVAFFMVDALRYELGVALEKQLSEDGKVELYPALAQLPSITKVGMASLLPRAGDALILKRKQDGTVIPSLDDLPLGNVNQRMDIFRNQYGQRFLDMTLNNFLNRRIKIDHDVDLLVLRSVEIDNQFESNPETAPGLIQDMLKRIRVAVHRLQEMGFHEIVIATDHGFVLNLLVQAGDAISKPPGDWINEHDRLLLGQGAGDIANFVMPAQMAGIRGDIPQIAGPRGLVPYRSGMVYFHGGVSLQELILPVIVVRLEVEKQDFRNPNVTVSYKNGSKRITTRLPVIDIILQDVGLFDKNVDLEILLEADSKGNVVGEAKSGGRVNPAIGTITLKPGEHIQVTMKMQADYEGKFAIKALNPTTLTAYCKIDLETDYVV